MPFASVLSLNPKCWRPAMRWSEMSSAKTFATLRLTKVLSWGPSPFSHMSMTSISPTSTALIRRSCRSWSTSAAWKSGWWRTLFIRSCNSAALKSCLRTCSWQLSENAFALWEDVGCIHIQRWKVSSSYILLHCPDWNYHWLLHGNVL